MLKNTTPITMGIGKKLLEKMGWKEGEGLGKTHKGVVEPIKPDIRVNRQGLSSQEDKKAAFIPIGSLMIFDSRKIVILSF